MWRKALLFSLGVTVLLFAGPSQAAMVQLTFEGTGFEYYYEYAPGYYTEWQGDPFDVTLDLLFRVDTWDQGPDPGDPSWEYLYATGTFVQGVATGAGTTLAFSADDLMAYPNQYNYAYADYRTNGADWTVNGYAAAGSWDEYGDGLYIAQGIGGQLYVEGNSDTQPIPVAQGNLFDWQAIMVEMPTFGDEYGPAQGDDNGFYAEHGLAFDGTYVGGGKIVPEPATVTLLGLGLSGMGLRFLSRKRAA